MLNEGGYGGAFFHAREGLKTTFLSEEWFKCFKAAVDEARKHNMTIWIYDELWWPSGFAGGLVPALGPKYRARALVLIMDGRAYDGEDVLAVFRCTLSPEGIPLDYEPAERGEERAGYLYLNFVKYTASVGETWFCGLSYVDLLDSGVVKKFIELAYEPYAKRFRDEFGKIIPGVFTDEPNFSLSRPPRRQRMPPRGPRIPPFAIPWTDRLPEKFRELNGYDIVPKLPELFFDIGNYMKTRYDFWRTITLLFIEAFSRQIYEWCDKHGLKFTGHYLDEDSLLSQMLSIGAAMPHYEHMHIPGIDHLGMQIWRGLLTVKQVASVANQLGRQRVLCEVYGCTGNYPTFEDRKWIGDWLLVMGVNLLNHHLVPYSMRGRRKRDYGLNFHWSQPWWRYNKLIEDYFARLSYVLSQGKRIAPVLVIHPIGSAWALYTPLNEEKVRELDDAFYRLLRTLLTLHVDFELGDEMLMTKYAHVRGSELIVGQARYRAVIIPPSVTLTRSTVKLLKEYIEKGGLVIAIKPLPSLIDAIPSEEIGRLLSRARVIERVDKELLARALKEVPKPVVIEGDNEGDVLYCLKEADGSFILFLVNTSRVRRHYIKAGVEGIYHVELWDPFTGQIIDQEVEVKDNRTWISLELAPVSSRLYVLYPGEPISRGGDDEVVTAYSMELNRAWRLKRLDPNVLVLDYCRYRVKGAWSDVVPVWRAHDEIVEKGLGTKFTLRFEFESKIDLKDRRIYLVIERPERYRIRVNGVEVKPKAEKYWIDWNFAMIDVSGLVGKGLNTIELEGTVDLEPEIECIYILGDFGVEIGPKGCSSIVEEPVEVDLGDLCRVGYPFYVGKIMLEKDIELKVPRGARVVLDMEKLDAALVIVYVNEKEAGKVILRRESLDITEYVHSGMNKIEILLIGTLRNALGPLHYRGGDPEFIGPETFRDIAHWTDEYILRPFGLTKVKLRVMKPTES